MTARNDPPPQHGQKRRVREHHVLPELGVVPPAQQRLQQRRRVDAHTGTEEGEGEGVQGAEAMVPGGHDVPGGAEGGGQDLEDVPQTEDFKNEEGGDNGN